MPDLKRFYFHGYLDAEPGLTASVGGYYERASKMTDEELKVAYADEAKARYVARGRPDAAPVSVKTLNHYELPTIPKPSATDMRPLKSWEVKADMVVHDIKFSMGVQAVFAWPEEAPQDRRSPKTHSAFYAYISDNTVRLRIAERQSGHIPTLDPTEWPGVVCRFASRFSRCRGRWRTRPGGSCLNCVLWWG